MALFSISRLAVYLSLLSAISVLGAERPIAKDCSALSSLIFTPDTDVYEAAEFAADCIDEPLGHSYLQSALLGTFHEQPEEIIAELGLPDAARSADSFFKAFFIRKALIEGAMNSGDEARRTYSYLGESAKRGSLYGSAYFTYTSLFNDWDWAGKFVQNLTPLGDAHFSAVKQLINHLNTVCFYSKMFPSKNPPAPEPLDLEHFWLAPEFAQMLVLLRKNECEHVEKFISNNELEPAPISDFFLTALMHHWEIENEHSLSVDKLRANASQYDASEIPVIVSEWVKRYKSSQPDNPLLWCDANQTVNLNLCYRTAFYQDFHCKSTLSVEGFQEKMMSSEEYDYCRSVLFLHTSGIPKTSDTGS
ncbi:hypothetical protein [Thalassospira australica]|uniref:hypothetical protein n=1 Tax=Thalassospira australica TaxID=1528106 RepID=UPI00051A818A|nr:hypothetical protein [Thalassospira australica]